jgi:hypothetical protein
LNINVILKKSPKKNFFLKYVLNLTVGKIANPIAPLRTILTLIRMTKDEKGLVFFKGLLL